MPKHLAEIINYDFRKIGYNYDGTAIIIAEKEDRIQILGQILSEPGVRRTRSIDTWWNIFLRDASDASGTSNEGIDIILVSNS
jgi:hypothetical protein